MDSVGILLQTPIFRDLSVQDVEELLPDLRERRYARGQTVWIEGDRAEVMIVLAEGQLKAHRVSRDGREVIVGVFKGVAVTGEVGLFHPVGIRWLSLSAMTAARCLMLRRAPLLGFLARHPAAMLRMLEQLSTAAVQAAYSFSGVAFDDIPRRVASLILHLPTSTVKAPRTDFGSGSGSRKASWRRTSPRLGRASTVRWQPW
jgi:CRP/FNR family transcriptional regulator, cyclic AMP receptor protein